MGRFRYRGKKKLPDDERPMTAAAAERAVSRHLRVSPSELQTPKRRVRQGST